MYLFARGGNGPGNMCVGVWLSMNGCGGFTDAGAKNWANGYVLQYGLGGGSECESIAGAAEDFLDTFRASSRPVR